MTITPEMLAAYADGELGAEDAAEVEAAMAADPELEAEVAAHRALRQTLSAHFAPILQQPVPDRLTAALNGTRTPIAAATAAGEQVREQGGNVVDLAHIRREREKKRQAQVPRRSVSPGWAIGGTLAASLALALLFGSRLSTPGGNGIDMKNGELVASGALDKALTTQLASSQGDAPVRILLSFKAQDGRYCRGFEQGSTAGIACRAESNWQIVRTQSGAVEKTNGNYRQAGSGAADIMAAAQDMADGAALDARAERSAREAGWRP